MAKFNLLQPFKFWTHKVLPLVYDDSLSYYEAVQKVYDSLNKVIESHNSIAKYLNEDLQEMLAYLDAELKNTKDRIELLEADGSVTTERIADGAVSEGKLANGAVTSAKLQTNAVEQRHLKPDIVSTDKLQDGAVTEDKIANFSVSNGKIKPETISGDKIMPNAIWESRINDNSVSERTIVDGAVSGGKLANGAVSEGKLANGAVSEGKLANGAVSEGKLANGAVTEDKLANGAVTSAKLQTNAVEQRHLKPDIVSTDKLQDGAVTEDKIANFSVSNGKIKPETISGDKIMPNAIWESRIHDGSVTPIKTNGMWRGKKGAFFGDSLTENNYHYSKGYHAWLKELLGLESVVNYGKSGYNLSDIYESVCLAIEPADIVFVMGGVNDQTHSIPLGTISDNTTETTYGALNLLCEKLVERYPTSAIVFITPHFQTKYPHNDGVTSYDIRNAIIDVCEKYSICVYDNFINSGFRNNNLSLYTTDGCHWNNTAHEIVGKNVAMFVSQNFYSNLYYTPKNAWIGKTVTCGLGDVEDNSCHLVALVAVDDDVTSGATVTRELTAVECVNMSNASITGGNCYGDNSGAVSNASWTSNCSKPSVHNQTVNSNNVAHWEVGVQTFHRDVTEPYIKVPICVTGNNFPFSFKIADIVVKVNGKEKPIIALGSFFKSDKEVLTIS